MCFRALCVGPRGFVSAKQEVWLLETVGEQPGDPCVHMVHVCVLVFLGPSAMNVSAGMFWCCTRGGHICLGTIQAPFPFLIALVFLYHVPPAKSRTNKQTNTWEPKLPITTTLQMQPGLACISPVATATVSQGVNQNILSSAQHPHMAK